MAETLDSARRVEDAGAAALVMYSLFEEQITAEALATHGSMDYPAESFGEALSYFPEPEHFAVGPHGYLERLSQLKEALQIPVIASLNGRTPGGWLRYAQLMEAAGASAIELNTFSVATDPQQSAMALEDELVEIVRTVKSTVSIPVTVKLSPFYTSLPNLASRLIDAGAAGLVLFNRFFEPDLDIEELEVLTQLKLSSSAELLLRLRWLGILSTLPGASLAVTGGVHATTDVVKAIMCGADVVQLVSALLIYGPQRLSILRDELGQWLEEHEYASLSQLRGSMNMARCPNPSAFERGNYVKMLRTWNVDPVWSHLREGSRG
jgi:dihydroorotate dehydrogenase (fumarate)